MSTDCYTVCACVFTHVQAYVTICAHMEYCPLSRPLLFFEAVFYRTRALLFQLLQPVNKALGSACPCTSQHWGYSVPLLS